MISPNKAQLSALYDSAFDAWHKSERAMLAAFDVYNDAENALIRAIEKRGDAFRCLRQAKIVLDDARDER